MDLEKMYKGIPFSPVTTLSEDINASATVIKVADINAFPDGPNFATIGTDEQAETIYYATKSSDQLSGCIRAIEGSAKEWQTGELIGRNFTAKDYENLILNINKLNEKKLESPASTTNENIVVFDESGLLKDSGKKVTDFEAAGAANLVQNDLNTHKQDKQIHIDDLERQKWNSAVTDQHTHSNKTVLDGITEEKVQKWDTIDTVSSNLTSHTGDSTIHVTEAEKTTWNGKADASSLEEIETTANAAKETAEAALPIAGGTLTGLVTAGGDQAVATAQIRNIYAGTSDMEAGVTPLPTGTIYFVYE